MELGWKWFSSMPNMRKVVEVRKEISIRGTEMIDKRWYEATVQEAAHFINQSHPIKVRLSTQWTDPDYPLGEIEFTATHAFSSLDSYKLYSDELKAWTLPIPGDVSIEVDNPFVTANIPTRPFSETYRGVSIE
jgi:hypothetical protein